MNIDNKETLPIVSIDELAAMTAKGFSEAQNNLDQGLSGLKNGMVAEFASVRCEMKEEFTNVRNEMKEGFNRVDKEFMSVRDEMKYGFERIDKEFVSIRSSIDRINDTLITISENMATKADIARMESRIIGIEHAVFNDHGPRIVKMERKLQTI
jgi:hypothetical protein